MVEQNGINNAAGDEDTISLIDIVAVVLRRRRMILVSILGVACLSLALYLVYPEYMVTKARKNQVAEVNVSFMLSSSLKAILGEAESVNFILQALEDPVNLLTALRGAGFTELDDKTPIDASVDDDTVLFSIRRRVIQNKNINGDIIKGKYADIFSVSIKNGVGYITFLNKDAIRAKKFLSQLVNDMNSSVAEYVKPYAKSKLEAYENLLLIEKPSEVVGITIVQGYESYSLIKSYLFEGRYPVTILRLPYVFQAEISKESMQKDTLKKCVIAVFAAFFLSVFAAFALQYIETVRNDPEAMGKIHEALGKKK